MCDIFACHAVNGCECECRFIRYHFAVLCPVVEHIAEVRACCQSHCRAVVECSGTCYCSVSIRFDARCDFKSLDSEVSDQISGLCHCESVACIGRDHCVAICPVDEVVFDVWCSRHCALCAFGISAAACHCAACRRIGSHRDDVTRCRVRN